MNASINQMGMEIPVEMVQSQIKCILKFQFKVKRLNKEFLMEKHCGQQISCQ